MKSLEIEQKHTLIDDAQEKIWLADQNVSTGQLAKEHNQDVII